MRIKLALMKMWQQYIDYAMIDEICSGDSTYATDADADDDDDDD